ncbi:TCR/Tet family MFS transporter [Thalassococcus sp. S3]|uniref:TCR/Tet family MFS transporter n=1 Tax=Thalassococcus sp. S3 TaxID=2017482 RepID=UPI001024530C|nr:TCR/Tet family MFS transporter [Thalassococcus sp. S3]QBF30711.1 tetracycline resistance MFS efflux pump [Thalassococcus sp. S3]
MRLPVLFIMTNVMLDAMGIGLIVPVMPDLIRDIEGGTLAGAAVWGGILSTIYAVMQFLFGPTLGSLSDRYGRRPILLISLGFMSLSYFLMATAGSMMLLIVARIVGGITAASYATASAYMADISKPHEKAANFGLIGAGFGAGFVLGPLIGGFLGELGPRAPFYAAAGLAALNTVFGFFVLKETVTDAIRRPFDWRRANPLGAFRQVAKLPGIGHLLAVYFIYQVAFNVYPSVWSFYTQERFGWSAQTIGLSLALFGIMMAIVQGGLIRLVLRWWGERRTVIYGHVFDILVFGLIAIISSGAIALVLTPLAALGAVITPALQGMMSQRVSNDAQGELQGVLGSMNALATILAPLTMTSTFALFTAPNTPVYLPGAPFLLSMVLVGVALVIFARRPSGMT